MRHRNLRETSLLASPVVSKPLPFEVTEDFAPIGIGALSGGGAEGH